MNTPPLSLPHQRAKPIRRLATTRGDLFVFCIVGPLSIADTNWLAQTVQTGMDAHYRGIDLVLVFIGPRAGDYSSSIDEEVFRARTASLHHVRNLWFVSTESVSTCLTKLMSSVAPQHRHVAQLSEIETVWAYLGARPQEDMRMTTGVIFH